MTPSGELFTEGEVMKTSGVDELPDCVKAEALRQVATFSDFTLGNDPGDEHDFGRFILWWVVSSCGKSIITTARWSMDRKYRADPGEDDTRPHDNARERVLIGRAPTAVGEFTRGNHTRNLPAKQHATSVQLKNTSCLCTQAAGFTSNPATEISTSKEDNHVVDHSRRRSRNRLRRVARGLHP